MQAAAASAAIAAHTAAPHQPHAVLRHRWSALSSSNCAACVHASNGAASVRSFSSSAAAPSSSAADAPAALPASPLGADEAAAAEEEDEDDALDTFDEDVFNEEEEELMQAEMERQQEEDEEELVGGPPATGDSQAKAAVATAASGSTPAAAGAAPAGAASVNPIVHYTRSVSALGLALMSRYPIVAVRGMDLRLEPDWQRMRDQAQSLLENLVSEIATDPLAPMNHLSWETTREILLLCKNFQLYSHALTVWKRVTRPQSDNDVKLFYASAAASAAATAASSTSSSSSSAAPTSASASDLAVASVPVPAARPPLPSNLLVPRKLVHMILECATKSLGPEGGHALLRELDSLDFAERSCLTSRAWSLILKGYADKHIDHPPSQRIEHLNFLKKYYDAIPEKDEWVHGMMLDIYLEWCEKRKEAPQQAPCHAKGSFKLREFTHSMMLVLSAFDV